MTDEQIKALRVECEAKESTIMAVVHTLGGAVEGHPTSRVNFLQRLRAVLVAIERVKAKCEDEASGHPILQHSRGYRDACVDILALLEAEAKISA